MAHSRLRLAIIGIGRMGITHYSVINNHPKVKITAVVDTSSIILNMLKKYKKDINVYSDYNLLFEKEELDAVIVCTPPALHYPIIIKAGQKGIHVFSEKPFTKESSQAKELAALFKQKNLINQVGYVNRFNDVFKTVKQHIDNGLIGDVIRFKSEMYSKTITKADDAQTWRAKRENGGGAVFEVASHAIDLVNFIIGQPEKITGSCLVSIFSKNVEDAVNATFLYKNGISGTLNVNWSDESYRKPTNKIEIFGSKGKILADQHSLKIFLKDDLPEHNFIKGWNTVYITDVFNPVQFYVRGNEYSAQLYHFIDCILGAKAHNECTFNDACKTHDVIEAIFNDYAQNGSF